MRWDVHADDTTHGRLLHKLFLRCHFNFRCGHISHHIYTRHNCEYIDFCECQQRQLPIGFKRHLQLNWFIICLFSVIAGDYPVPVVIAAGAVAVALGARAEIADARNRQLKIEQETQVLQQIDRFLLNAAGADDDEGPHGGAQTPMNKLSIPVTGADSRDDGCGDTFVRVAADGQCHPLLRRGPCPDPFHWVTVNPINLTVNPFSIWISHFI